MSDKRRTIERFNQGTNRKRGDTSKCCISPSEGVLHGRFVELLGQHLLVSDEIQLVPCSIQYGGAKIHNWERSTANSYLRRSARDWAWGPLLGQGFE
ncbi:hypothetical protein AcW1_007379 [Taiwanofungus camphoratus]|nr:hypothetical protein AcW1_007379 [Antrodia cinnamomea]